MKPSRFWMASGGKRKAQGKELVEGNSMLAKYIKLYMPPVIVNTRMSAQAIWKLLNSLLE
jgi:hypothetical protein